MGYYCPEHTLTTYDRLQIEVVTLHLFLCLWKNGEWIFMFRVLKVHL